VQTHICLISFSCEPAVECFLLLGIGSVTPSSTNCFLFHVVSAVNSRKVPLRRVLSSNGENALTWHMIFGSLWDDLCSSGWSLEYWGFLWIRCEWCRWCFPWISRNQIILYSF